MTSSLNSYANTPNVIVVIAEDAAITTITLGVLTYEPIGSIGNILYLLHAEVMSEWNVSDTCMGLTISFPAPAALTFFCIRLILSIHVSYEL